ncbi:MAG: hypothetical protein QOI81_1908 [Actinomycetota bacterium]|nr:hypothetical protein [Actinomycetota bacterium]
MGHLVSGSAAVADGRAEGPAVAVIGPLVPVAALVVGPLVAEQETASERTSKRVDRAAPVLIGPESMPPGSSPAHPMCDHVSPSTEGARVGREEDLPHLDRRDPGGG